MKLKCLKCNDIIESLSVHDYKQCKCRACSIDGGNEYTRVAGDLKYMHWVYDDGREEEINVNKNSKNGKKLEKNKQESMEIKPNNSINNKKELTINNIADGIINLSNIFSNQQNNNPKITVKRYRTLSKQAMKEYAIRKANASSFDWEDEEEM